ncbi:hypothetical protein J2X06_000382 [Lysobacter niastensis]|uniref:DUF1214 domain-containing protein n=2 Tax=Lysobacter niastensis TaxID=380629 RepID=A0ABU1W6I3_9GAMM|nr:hypothetical protein [Lysobacter niastensis]
MLPGLKKDADGGLTLYIQADSPGKDKQANWLPAPKGPFVMFARYYWPTPALLDGQWTTPPVVKRPDLQACGLAREVTPRQAQRGGPLWTKADIRRPNRNRACSVVSAGREPSRTSRTRSSPPASV